MSERAKTILLVIGIVIACILIVQAASLGETVSIDINENTIESPVVQITDIFNARMASLNHFN